MVLESAIRSTCSLEPMRRMASNSASSVDKVAAELALPRPSKHFLLAYGVKIRPDKTLLLAP